MESAIIARPARTIRGLRWWICSILFASTTINYIDRQTLSLLAPFLKITYHWTNSDYANIIIAFRVAYAIGQTASGRFIDRVGTRAGITFSVIFYSVVSIFTPLANGLLGFMGFRFLLGLGESANWPAATKAVSEWFPARERGLATAFFDSGSSVGGAISPFLVFWIYRHWGWRPAFVVPGLLGLLWLLLWRRFYYKPEQHPNIDPREQQMLADDKAIHATTDYKTRARWRDLIKLPDTWGIIAARAFTDPVWYFVTDWFPLYLVAKGVNLSSGILVVWVPFVAADAGNFTGGLVSGWLIRRGWPMVLARKAVIIGGGIGTLLLIPTVFTDDLLKITFFFALATFSYASFSTIANVLPADLFPSRAVATVSGMSGTGSGIGTIIAMKAVGYLSDARQGAGTHAFDPIVIGCAFLPTVGMLLVLMLIQDRRTRSDA